MAAWAVARRGRKDPRLVNDVHAKLNPTRVARIARPRSLDDLVAEGRRGGALIASGSRHAMGGQQFGTEATLLDMRGCRRVLDFDAERGLVEVEAGIEWPRLLRWLLRHAEEGGEG